VDTTENKEISLAFGFKLDIFEVYSQNNNLESIDFFCKCQALETANGFFFFYLILLCYVFTAKILAFFPGNMMGVGKKNVEHKFTDRSNYRRQQ
jgi:hypothetical protein